MSELLDLISPVDMGSDKIVLSVDNLNDGALLVSRPITLLFDYSLAAPNGVVLPLVLQVQPAFGSGVGYVEKVFRRFAPESYAFTVPSAGIYLAVLRECYHQRWQGRILFEVEGDEFSQIVSSR